MAKKFRMRNGEVEEVDEEEVTDSGE